jgi:hypothetical protein
VPVGEGHGRAQEAQSRDRLTRRPVTVPARSAAADPSRGTAPTGPASAHLARVARRRSPRFPFWFAPLPAGLTWWDCSIDLLIRSGTVAFRRNSLCDDRSCGPRKILRSPMQDAIVFPVDGLHARRNDRYKADNASRRSRSWPGGSGRS